jgi:DNA-binding Lrp family transcriptional regulator
MKPKFKGQVELLELNLKQLEALASFACSEVYAGLSTSEGRSIREIAELLGKSPAAVNEQMAKLVKVGLALQVGTRKRRSRTEALYATSCMTEKTVLTGKPWKFAEAFMKRFEGQMRLMVRQHRAAQEAMRKDRSFIAFMTSRGRVAYLTPESTLRVKQKFTELLNLVAELDETDPEVRAGAGHVRVAISVQMLPSIPESKKVLDQD